MYRKTEIKLRIIALRPNNTPLKANAYGYDYPFVCPLRCELNNKTIFLGRLVWLKTMQVRIMLCLWTSPLLQRVVCVNDQDEKCK